MGLFTVTQHFDNAKSKSFKVPADTAADVVSFATAVCDGAFEVLTPVSSTGTKEVTAYKMLCVICQNVVDDKIEEKAYLNIIVKPTTTEGDIQAALLGKTYNDGVSSFSIDRVGVIEKKVAA